MREDRIQIESLTDHVWGVQHTDWMLPLFHSFARKYAPFTVGEIGFRGGVSASAWLIAARDYGGLVYSMDVDECRRGLETIATVGLSRWHRFIHSDSRYGEFPEPLDILYIDGDHSYEGVKNDRERYGHMVKSGGLILYHDTISWPEVGQYIRERGNVADIRVGAGLGVEVVP